MRSSLQTRRQIYTKYTSLYIRNKLTNERRKTKYNIEENLSLIAIECTGESKLKFIISDHDDNQFKMYMENIKRVKNQTHCVTKCVNHYKQNCMARLLISTSLKTIKNGNKFEFGKSVKRAQLVNVKNYSILPHKVSTQLKQSKN